MYDSEAKRRATDALITRMITALDLKCVEPLPASVYGFASTDDWFLFVMDDMDHGSERRSTSPSTAAAAWFDSSACSASDC